MPGNLALTGCAAAAVVTSRGNAPVSAALRTPGVGGGGGEYLATQAAALQPGYWVQLTGMSNFNWPLIRSPDGAEASILDFGSKGTSDVPGGLIRAIGGAHNGAGGLTGAIQYNRTTNTWSQITPHYSATQSHAWDGQTYEPSTGDWYAYEKSSGKFWRRLSGSSTWTQIATLTAIGPEETIGLTWDEARGAAGGLVAWSDNGGAFFWAKSAGSGSWSAIVDPGASGPYHMTANFMRATGECFLGDGDASPTTYYLLAQNNSIPSFTAPVNVAGCGSSGNLLAWDWASERLIVANPRTGVNDLRSFNPFTRQWRSFTPSNGAIPMSQPAGAIEGWSVSIEDIGCMLFVIGHGTGNAPTAYLYKHTSAPIVPQTITFSAPGSHDMTQYVEEWNSSTMTLSIDQTLPGWLSFNGTSLVASGAGSVSGLTLRVNPA